MMYGMPFVDILGKLTMLYLHCTEHSMGKVHSNLTDMAIYGFSVTHLQQQNKTLKEPP